MTDFENCSGCANRDDCKKTYEQLGKCEGSHVVLRSIMAFVVPVLLFSAGLAIFDRIFSDIISDKTNRTVFSLILSLIICAVYILVIKLIGLKLKKSEPEGTS